MCIVLISTAHPQYPFILLSNRDEFIHRPTALADWWETPYDHVLGARDLERRERGTWLGITRQGRIATLTNFREDGAEKALDKSRGGIINAYLTSSPQLRESPETFAHRLINEVGVHDVGGFSLMFGELQPPTATASPTLSVLSNRSASVEDIVRLPTAAGKTYGLSNSHFADTSWPKVSHGKEWLLDAIKADVERDSPDEAVLVESLFDVLSVNELRPQRDDEEWDTYTRQMRNSIFIPVAGGPEVESKPAEEIAAARPGRTTASDLNTPGVRVGEKAYGTQKQTVILVNVKGRVLFVERTLYRDDGTKMSAGAGDRRFEFQIEHWNS